MNNLALNWEDRSEGRRRTVIIAQDERFCAAMRAALTYEARLRQKVVTTASVPKPVTKSQVAPVPAPVPIELPAGHQPVRDWLLLPVLPPGESAAINDPYHWRRIRREVAAKHDLTEIELCSKRQNRRLVWPRYEAMWRMRNETTMSLPAIGKRLGGRDHTTVLHGIKRYEERLAEAQAVPDIEAWRGL